MLNEAIIFATSAHNGQYRKYTKQPYILHPLRVLACVANHYKFIYDEHVQAAAVLHDVIEDCNVNYDDIYEKFGRRVANYVLELSNPSKGLNLPRAERKRIDREHIATVSQEARIIKLYDRADNIAELNRDLNEKLDVPLDFVKLYLKESKALNKALEGTDIWANNALEYQISVLSITQTREEN